jgi:hypothetical protein
MIGRMHANVVTVEVRDADAGLAMLRDEVIPMIKQAPGFVGGYWWRGEDGDGHALVIFESEEAANGMAERSRATATEDGPATMRNVETVEIVASA